MSQTNGLFVCNTFYPDSAGVGNATAHLCRALNEYSSINPHVIVPKRTDSPNREYYQGTQIIRVPLGRWARHPLLSFPFYPLFGVSFFRELHRLQPSFILFQNAWEAGGLIPIARMARTNSLIMVHTHADVRYASRFESWASIAYRTADVVLSTTSQYVQDLKSRYGCANVKIVPNAYYTPEGVTGTRAAVKYGNGREDTHFHIASVGRMVIEKDSETKGISYLLKAVAQVPKITLHLFGDGPNREDYERLAANLGVSARCLFHGQIPSSEMLQNLKACDALVMSSLHEGLSMSLLEAISMGIPVISTDTAGARDHIRDRENGLLVATGNIAAMAAALNYAQANRMDMVQMGNKAMETYEQRFHPHVVAARFERLIETMSFRTSAGKQRPLVS